MTLGNAPAYLPIDGRPLRVQMGTRPLDLDDWIEVDEHRQAELAEKDRLLREQREQVLAATPQGEPGAREALELLAEFLPARFPAIYSHSAGAVRDLHTGQEHVLGAGAAIETAGRLVQEDLCVMSQSADGAWVLTAASLCFPSRWSLLDKIGRNMAAIHAPVPFYAERIGTPAEQFFDRLEPARPVWRLNWTLVDSPELFQPRPPGGWSGLGPGEDLGERMHLRVERQTLRRLPRTGDILFTIRTYVRSLASLGEVRPGIYRDLVTTLDGTPDETSEYKGWTPLLAELRQWLADRA